MSQQNEEPATLNDSAVRIEDLQGQSVTHEKLRELETEEYFIEKLKKQREKVELLRLEFQEQEKTLERQQAEIADWHHENEELRRIVDQHVAREKELEAELADRDARLFEVEKKSERTAVELHRTRDAYEQCRESLRLSSEKLAEQEAIFARSFEALRAQAKNLQKQTQVLKEKYKQKTVLTNELYRSLQLAQKSILKLQQQSNRNQAQTTYNTQQLIRRTQSQQRQIIGLQRQTQSQKSKMASQHKLIAEFQQQQVKYQAQIHQMQNQLQTKQLTTKKLQDDIKRCLEQIKALEQDLDRRESVIKDLTIRKKASRKYDHMKKQLTQMRDREAEQLDILIQTVSGRRRGVI